MQATISTPSEKLKTSPKLLEGYWLLQREADVPPENDWLSANEAACLSGLRFAKRRADWRLGRWTAKLAVSLYLSDRIHTQALANIEIRPAPSGAPEVSIADQTAGISISLSHSSGVAVCALAPYSTALGCDVEAIEPRNDAFVADYFTAEEQEMVAHTSAIDRPRLVTLIWSAKESALKALQEGLRLDTRTVAVCARSVSDLNHENQDWSPLYVRVASGKAFSGWWRQTGNLMFTLVASQPQTRPINLKNFE
jgi:4'-phosphopantetheinyl transferase